MECHHPLPGHQLPAKPGGTPDGDHRPVGQAHQQLRRRPEPPDRGLHAHARHGRDPQGRHHARPRRRARRLPARLQLPRRRQTRISQPQHLDGQDADRHHPGARPGDRRQHIERIVHEPDRADARHRRMPRDPPRPRPTAAPHGRDPAPGRTVRIRRARVRIHARQAGHQGPRLPVEHRRARPRPPRRGIRIVAVPSPHPVDQRTAAGTERPANQRPDLDPRARQREHPPRPPTTGARA